MVHVYRLLDIDSEQIQYVKYEFMTKMCFKGVYFLKVHCPQFEAQYFQKVQIFYVNFVYEVLFVRESKSRGMFFCHRFLSIHEYLMQQLVFKEAYNVQEKRTLFDGG